MIYKWKAAAHAPIEAQVAGEELERIRVRHNGRLEAADVVAASRSKNAPLHLYFEWDDEAAAVEHRKAQAAYLIRSIEVMVDKPDGGEAPIRAFVSVQRDEDRSYTSVQHALSDEDLRGQVLRQAWSELEAWRRRYAELIELGKVFSLIDQARGAE